MRQRQIAPPSPKPPISLISLLLLSLGGHALAVDESLTPEQLGAKAIPFEIAIDECHRAVVRTDERAREGRPDKKHFTEIGAETAALENTIQKSRRESQYPIRDRRTARRTRDS